MDEPIVELISYADHTHSCKVCETGDHDDCDCGYNDAHAKMWAAWEALKAENERLRIEVEILRQYGNKDCLAMADEALREAQGALVSNAALSAVPNSAPAQEDGK